MIKKTEVLTLAEAKELVEKQEKKMKEQKEESQENIESAISYLKKFSKLNAAKSKQLKEELKKLDIMQLKDKNIAKIADLLPVEAEDLHKILVGESVSLDKNEVDKILDMVKKYIK